MSFGGRKGKRNRMADVKERILQLRREIEYHRQRYYTDDAPEITDFAFDALFRELQELEASHPEYYDENSPVYRVGGEAQDKFEKITHAHPLKSLTDVFSYEELRNFLQGLEREFGPLEYSVEPKIDGSFRCARLSGRTLSVRRHKRKRICGRKRFLESAHESARFL